MVKGLELFQRWFADYADQYVLIGGTAASLAMEQAGLTFRATKDLDIVLHVEALTPAFGAAFWKFVAAGAYEIRQVSGTGKPVFYRFQKPADARYPVMVELFARAPQGYSPPPAVCSHPYRWMKRSPVCQPSCSTTPTTHSFSRDAATPAACLGSVKTA